MYQLADKNKIMSLFHKGQSISQIRLESNVSKSTLYRWKEEYDTTGKIIRYIRKGKLDEARREVSQFQETHKNSSVLLIRKVINQFSHFGYLDDAKELAEELLKQYPNNLPERSQLVTIAKQKGNLEEAERLCREILALESNNRIAKKQLKTIESMQKEQQRIKDKETQSDDSTKEKDGQCVQKNIRIIRRQIRAGTFSLENIEATQSEMQKMGINEVQINILLAEAYERQNLPRQTKTYLKKALQGTQEPELQKVIKALLQVAQTKKKKPSHKNPWEIAVSITSTKKIGQTPRRPKELDEK